MDDRQVPMIRIENHVYVRILAPLKMPYTTAVLEKIHRHFFHPSADKPFNLICRAKLDEKLPALLNH